MQIGFLNSNFFTLFQGRYCYFPWILIKLAFIYLILIKEQ